MNAEHAKPDLSGQKSDTALPIGMIPNAHIDRISGLIEFLHAENTPSDLSEVATQLVLDIDELLPIWEALILLDFAVVHEGQIKLTGAGKAFAEGSIDERKQIFRAQLISQLPETGKMHNQIRGGARIKRMLRKRIWRNHEWQAMVDTQRATIMEWGRYAELFDD